MDPLDFKESTKVIKQLSSPKFLLLNSVLKIPNKEKGGEGRNREWMRGEERKSLEQNAATLF